jgi:hypothetical protein
LRSGINAARHPLDAADPGLWPLLASDGMGTAARSADESGWAVVALGYGMGGTVLSPGGSGWAESGSGNGSAGSDMCLPSASGQGVVLPTAARLAMAEHLTSSA